MMTRLLGNTVAKNFSMGRRQYRDFSSSMGEKDAPMGDMELFVNNEAGLLFKGASGVVGFVVGGLAAEDVKETEELIKRWKQCNDKHQRFLERAR
ncbi:unnamed protein product [Thlaspi arvense]|uniref:Uncharacterized protein n=1 Tax=Thlaspi arvense TaxID=13288 RepID=A0AAU9T1L1_THLAR|nr:unnamed protein product [Thlaspi arvense]